MESVREIVQAYGHGSVQDMATGSTAEVEPGGGMMPLVIEKVGKNRVSVAHYRGQRGDLMRDPEIVFHIGETGEWTPTEYTQDPGTYQRDRDGLRGAKEFAKQWDKNLATQGYVEAAQKQVTHQ